MTRSASGATVPATVTASPGYGAQEGEGVEYHLLALGLALALIVNGAGAWSIDALHRSPVTRGQR